MYEMLRSFCTVAETLSITKSVDRLGFTRQTIRRHLDDLEELLNCKLFQVSNRQYSITKDGLQYLEGARELLDDLGTWLTDKYVSRNELEKIQYHEPDPGFFYFCQQQQLVDVWDKAMPMIRDGLSAWADASAKTEHPAIEKIRPYLLIYRRNRGDWICTHVGEKSSYATWLGLTWAKSAIGQAVFDDTSNSGDKPFLVKTYDTIFYQGCPRYDHIYGKYAREENGVAMPVSFQRLMLPLILPNGDPVLGVLVGRTNDIAIDLPTDVQFVPTPGEETMDEITC